MIDRPLFCFDLELNQPSQKIIELGYCVGDLQTGAIINGGNSLIKIDEPLDAFVSKLTGIQEQDLTTDLKTGYDEMRRLFMAYGCWGNALQWGVGDLECLAAQVKPLLKDIKTEWCFGRRAIDVKSAYQLWAMSQPSWALTGKSPKIRCGLAKALTQLNLKFEGTKHRAQDDATNTFRVAYELSKEMRLSWG